MFQKIKIIGVAIGIIFFLLSLLSALQFFRFQQLLFDITQARVEVPADALKRDIERSIASGIAVHTNAQVPLMLDSVIQNNPIVLSIELAGLGSRDREILWSSGKTPSSSQAAGRVGASSRSAPSSLKPGETPVFVQQWPIVDSLGLTVAQLVVVSDKSEALNIVAKARDEILTLAITLCLASLALLAPILYFLLVRLDRIVLTAKSIMLGTTVDKHVVLNSEICQLAQNAQDNKNASRTMTREATPS
ncbi:MAG: hypothetical protein NBV66_02915 [Burkholderiaceae bacterium]|nr:hypothetical protein [Burkholderiaceae bacterium]